MGSRVTFSAWAEVTLHPNPSRSRNRNRNRNPDSDPEPNPNPNRLARASETWRRNAKDLKIEISAVAAACQAYERARLTEVTDMIGEEDHPNPNPNPNPNWR